ncbi:MAG: DUF885 domain-containing protein [Chryseolinea sp.]
MKHSLFILTVLSVVMLSCSSPSKNEAQETQQPSLDSLLNQYHEERLKLSPFDATMAGDNRYNDLLPNTLTADYRKQVSDFYSRYRTRLTAFDRNTLSQDDQMNYDVLLWECDITLEGLKFKDYLTPINQFWGMHLMIGQLASGSSIQPFKTVKDYDNWLSRLNAYVEWSDTAIVNMRKGIAEKYIIPKVLTEKVIPQLASFDHGPVKDHLYYSPVKNFPADFSAEDKTRLTKAYEDIIQSKIIPTHKKLKDFMVKEYLPACRASAGIDAVPNGKEYYAYLIKVFTTTTKSADEIFALGKSEVDRITKEMESVKEQVGFKGDMKAFFNHLRTRKELMPFTKPEQVIANFNAIHEKMKPNLAKLFDKTPKTPFEVKRTEAFREASASAEYNPGSQDGTRAGVFYVPIPDVKKYNVLSDEDLFLHEAIPGHHYQISLQMENTSLPQFRRILNYSSYAEGWALYTESLGKELGLYSDPYQYFGMLSAEMHRAIRLVVDAGMHTQGWTREQAIQYSKDHEAETEDGIISEIERYMAIPGQALSYKVGQLKIRELRAKAEKELGDKFSIAQFHNQVLDSGCIPLNVLEQKINRWIESVKKQV